MHRFYVAPEQSRTDHFALDEHESHHALVVLRLRKGDEVTVLDGAGGQLRCEVTELSKRSVYVKVLERVCVPRLPFQITLLQAVPKAKIIESIIQKATELGVARIVPLLTERVATRLDKDEAADKQQKWQQVAVEAIKQCGQAWLPRVETPVTPQDFLKRSESFDLPCVGSLQPDSRHPREYFQRFLSEKGKKPATVALWIGPEGDFSPSEMEVLKSSGVLPITLGPLVLRCETAATYCMSIAAYELQS